VHYTKNKQKNNNATKLNNLLINLIFKLKQLIKKGKFKKIISNKKILLIINLLGKIFIGLN